MTPYMALRNAVTQRGRVTTAYEVRDALTAYLASLRQPIKSLGDGTLCVFDTKGRMRMMTRAEYTEMVHTRKRNKLGKRKNKHGDRELFYQGQIQEIVLVPDPTGKEMHDDWAAEVDEFAARQRKEEEDNGYHGAF